MGSWVGCGCGRGLDETGGIEELACVEPVTVLDEKREMRDFFFRIWFGGGLGEALEGGELLLLLLLLLPLFSEKSLG